MLKLFLKKMAKIFCAGLADQYIVYVFYLSMAYYRPCDLPRLEVPSIFEAAVFAIVHDFNSPVNFTVIF